MEKEKEKEERKETERQSKCHKGVRRKKCHTGSSRERRTVFLIFAHILSLSFSLPLFLSLLFTLIGPHNKRQSVSRSPVSAAVCRFTTLCRIVKGERKRENHNLVQTKFRCLLFDRWGRRQRFTRQQREETVTDCNASLMREHTM